MDLLDINYTQTATVLFACLVLYEQFLIYKLDKTNWKRALNPTVWAIHLLIFYAVVFLDGINVSDVHVAGFNVFTTWSQFLRLHSAISFYLVLKSAYSFMKITKKTEEIITKFSDKSESTNVT